MAMKPKTIISKTLALFSKPAHWTKGYLEHTNEEGEACYCLAGGLNYVATGGGYGHPADERQAKYLSEAKSLVLGAIKHSNIGSKGYRRTIVQWNDAKNRTIGDVRKVLRMAMKAAA